MNEENALRPSSRNAGDKRSGDRAQFALSTAQLVVGTALGFPHLGMAGETSTTVNRWTVMYTTGSIGALCVESARALY